MGFDIINSAIAASEMVAPAAEEGTFHAYLWAVIHSREFVQFWVLMVCGFLGVVANYLWKWANDQIKGSIVKYLFTDYPKRTLLSFMAMTGWSFVAMTSMVTPNLAWSILINMGVTTGFAVDAVINKANRAQWTEEERAAKLNTDQSQTPPKDQQP